MPHAQILPSLTVISASAGSGKTRALTNEFLSLWLSDRVPFGNLRNILAVTFTHNAANEMKRRVLETLKHLVLRDEKSDQLLSELSKTTGLSAEALVDVARFKLEELFDSYGDLQVQTIDSFIVDVFRTMAVELGFAPGAEIEIQSTELLERAFEEFLLVTETEAGQKALLNEVVALVQQTGGSQSRYLWDPFKHIVRETLSLHQRLQHIAKPVRQESDVARADEIRNELKTISTALQEKLENSHLSVNKNFQNDLRAIIGGDIETVLGRSTKEKFFNSPKNDDERKLVNGLQPSVEEDARRVYSLLSEYVTVRARSKYLPFLRTLSVLEERVRSIARREGFLTLDSISRALSLSVSRNVVPEIYYKLGENLHHFLFDEFQDTSPLQWSILKPLLEETLSGKGSVLVVGDTKQSIYSFRGADWRIMSSVEEGMEFSSVEPHSQTLDSNHRSDGVLVDYVHDLFSNRIRISEVGKAAALSGLTTYVQESTRDRKKRGYVRVDFVEEDSEKKPERIRLLEIIADLKSRKVPLSSIAVLAPRNSDVLTISSWLNEFNARQAHVEDQIPFIAHSGLDIRRRAVIRELMALLSFLDVPVDDLAFATILSSGVFANAISIGADRLGVERIQQFLIESRTGTNRKLPLYRAFEQEFPEMWLKYFQPLFTRVGYLSLYDIATEALKAFRVFEAFPDEQAAVVRFLEIIAAGEEEGKSVLKEFLASADDESNAERWQLAAPESANALRVMTIHKAKGLGFDTVILLMEDDAAKVRGVLVDDSGDDVALFSTMKEAIRAKSQTLTELYQKHLLFAQTDWLNTLYVALTRAERELHVIIVREGAKPKLLARLLAETELGKKSTREVASAEEVKTAILHRSTTPRKYEVVSTALPGFLEMRRGDAIHAALSKIQFVDGPPEEAARAAVALLNRNERRAFSPDELTKTLGSFLGEQKVLSQFHPIENRVVLNEREFANERGELFRCDRVVVDDDRVTVVDYKTGSDKKEEEYRQQLRNYKRILTDIFAPKPIRGLLMYVDLNKVVEVEG
jgi:ATP-dependent exoDNAse (exonuclease V) beta subunit